MTDGVLVNCSLEKYQRLLEAEEAEFGGAGTVVDVEGPLLAIFRVTKIEIRIRIGKKTIRSPHEARRGGGDEFKLGRPPFAAFSKGRRRR